MEFRHPKYYKELRKRNKLAESRHPVVGGQQQSDQSISLSPGDGQVERSTGPGPKQQAASDSQVVNQVKLSSQSQAASTCKPQATSKGKPQATSKRQASE